MAARIDFARAAERDRMARQGTEALDGTVPGGLAPPRPRPAKADLRAQAEAAVASVTRAVRCRCGHAGSIALPPSKIGARLRCSRCGQIARSFPA